MQVPTWVGGPDEKGVERAMLVQCHAPFGRPFAAPASLELGLSMASILHGWANFCTSVNALVKICVFSSHEMSTSESQGKAKRHSPEEDSLIFPEVFPRALCGRVLVCSLVPGQPGNV